MIAERAGGPPVSVDRGGKAELDGSEAADVGRLTMAAGLAEGPFPIIGDAPIIGVPDTGEGGAGSALGWLELLIGEKALGVPSVLGEILGWLLRAPMKGPGLMAAPGEPAGANMLPAGAM